MLVLWQNVRPRDNKPYGTSCRDTVVNRKSCIWAQSSVGSNKLEVGGGGHRAFSLLPRRRLLGNLFLGERLDALLMLSGQACKASSGLHARLRVGLVPKRKPVLASLCRSSTAAGIQEETLNPINPQPCMGGDLAGVFNAFRARSAPLQVLREAWRCTPGKIS